MSYLDHDVVTEAEKALYVGTHRGQYNEPLDKAKSHGFPQRPKHCVCPGCRNGFTHIMSVSR